MDRSLWTGCPGLVVMDWSVWTLGRYGHLVVMDWSLLAGPYLAVFVCARGSMDWSLIDGFLLSWGTAEYRIFKSCRSSSSGAGCFTT